MSESFWGYRVGFKMRCPWTTTPKARRTENHVERRGGRLSPPANNPLLWSGHDRVRAPDCSVAYHLGVVGAFGTLALPPSISTSPMLFPAGSFRTPSTAT